MEKSNVKIETDFDWDAIVVGDYRLDHSQNFFASAANKENRNINIEKYASTPLSKLSLRNADEVIRNKQIINISVSEVEITTIKKEPIRDNSLGIVEIMAIKEKMEEPIEDKSQEIQPEPKHEAVESVRDVQPSDSLVESPTDEPTKAKLRLEWSIMQPVSSTVPAVVAQPKAYGFKDVYQSKRDLALRQREEEERKAREFHSRPMPNFKALHRRLEDVQVVHYITVPKTPDTMKHWYADVERRKQKEQLQQQQFQPPRRLALQQQRSHQHHPSQADFKKSHHPSALKHDIKPFNLRSEQRVRERREYDAAVQFGFEQKKKQQDEQRKQREQEEIKELRKMTEFKARPNPFK